ncbi:preprotein translocase subunit SecG [Candidatus Saccharibacteria bacterium]|nr:preprotein translocase subunit SecG [Candidatus Saccharibacteria bacterium]
MELATIFQITTLVSAILVVLLILLQQRGASLGSGSGASSELYTTRRGLEKSMFNTTIVFSLVLVFSILGLLTIA